MCVVVPAFNPSKSRQLVICEFEVNLVYILISRSDRDTKHDFVSRRELYFFLLTKLDPS